MKPNISVLRVKVHGGDVRHALSAALCQSAAYYVHSWLLAWVLPEEAEADMRIMASFWGGRKVYSQTRDVNYWRFSWRNNTNV